MKAADLVEFEKVDIYNIDNGERFSTYVIEGDKGEISLNGAAARLVQKDDLVIIASYANYSEKEVKTHKAKLVFVDSQNRQKQL
jgi:aspartate 1-decarboxylase